MADLPATSTDPDSNGHSHRLTLYIVAAIGLAILVSLLVPALVSHDAALELFGTIDVGGDIFLRALTMLVVPLVVLSVMNGILGLGDVRKLGRPGATAIVYYISTTLLAVVVGLIVVNVIGPGKRVKAPEVVFQELQQDENEGTLTSNEFAHGLAGDKAIAVKEEFDKLDKDDDDLLTLDEFRNSDLVGRGDRKAILSVMAKESNLPEEKIAKIFPQLEDKEEPSLGTIFKGLLLMLFTDNLIEAAATTNLLPLIVFAIIFAGMLTTMGSRVDNITEIIGEANDAMMSFVMLLMKLAPIGIFCLIAARFGEAQTEGKFVETIAKTGWFVLTVLIGLGIHAFGTLPLIYWLLVRRNPYVFMRQMSRALLTAFSTASSSATLPVTMECANHEAGVSKRSTEFVLPLGATINMDGTALYEAAAAIFIAQMYVDSPEGIAAGFTLGIGTMLVIAITATLAAIGAAGIPEAGLVTMAIVLNAVGLPFEYVSGILAVDWLLDRFRTATNTFGDAVGAAIVDETFDDS